MISIRPLLNPRGLAAGIGAGLVLCASAAQGQAVPDVTQQIAGWVLSDTDRKVGDDSDRSLYLSRQVEGVSMIFSPTDTGKGASIRLKFTPCEGLNYSSGFEFDPPPEDHLTTIRKDVHEAYGDFAKRCQTAPASEDVLLAGLPEALAALEKRLAEMPFVYPPEPVAPAAPVAGKGI